jgi:hypothetical protein
MWESGTHIWFWWESQMKREHWEDLDIGGKIILKQIGQLGCGGMDWNQLAWDMDQWRAFVYMLVNLCVP